MKKKSNTTFYKNKIGIFLTFLSAENISLLFQLIFHKINFVSSLCLMMFTRLSFYFSFILFFSFNTIILYKLIIDNNHNIFVLRKYSFTYLGIRHFPIIPKERSLIQFIRVVFLLKCSVTLFST
jgi:hypothetical protein